jgi:sigma-B regulation protein RsbU (phosphoserine phosphatase)
MRLSTQLSVAFLLMAVLPPAGMTLYAYISSGRAYRAVVQAESERLAHDMSGQLEGAAEDVSGRIERMRTRPAREGASSAFEQARAGALAAAQEQALIASLRDILANTRREEGQIPFARDAEGRLYTAEAKDLPTLYGLGIAKPSKGVTSARLDRTDWVIAARTDTDSRVTVGVAAPVEQAVREMRATSLRNLGYGLALATLALVGIVPLSRRLTRHVEELTAGAERLGRGESDVQVPVPRTAELAKLAATFNRMARDLKEQQERLLAQERLRKELEISRRIQEELLPREPKYFAFAEAAGLSIPAREVGGDFFNYFELSPTEAAVLVGDVSGKGVPAAILMANLQATLSARLPLESDLSRLAERLDAELGSPDAAGAYLTLFIAIADGSRGVLRYVNAGHVTQILLRARGGLERLDSTGRPLGLLPGGGFEERSYDVSAGDTLLLFTDGLLDAEDPSGEAFGMERLVTVLESVPPGEPLAAVLGRIDAVLRAHRGGREAGDDATIVGLRVVAS